LLKSWTKPRPSTTGSTWRSASGSRKTRARAFDEACDRIDKLTELVMRLAGVCYGELDERLKIIAEAERMNDV
jgi:hypothetical protein